MLIICAFCRIACLFLPAFILLPKIQQKILATLPPHPIPSQPGQSPAADPSQQWDQDEEAAAQPYSQQTYESPQWEDEVTPAVQPFEAPRWDEQDSVSAQSGWSSETATPAHPHWEGDGVEHWGEEGSQVGQKQDADTNWAHDTAQAWEAESELPQWEELQSVRGTRLIVIVMWSDVIELRWFRSYCSVGVDGFHSGHVKCPSC